jgi:glycosyltransferase involved in cell wall biosynthesis
MGLISRGLPVVAPELQNQPSSRVNIEAGAAPLVTVITIFLNADRFIREAIESVLAQDFTNFELILVDDGSSDGSSAFARGYAERFPEKISYLEHENHDNKGMSASRNLGIRHSRGAYITFCDADDAWMPGKLSEQLEIFRIYPELGMVCSAANYWRSWMGGDDQVVLSGHVQNIPLRPPAACLAVDPLGGAVAPCNDLLVRRDVILQVGGFEDHFTGMYEDQAFLAKVYLATPVYFSSQVSLNYRRHPNSCMAVAERGGHYDAARRHFLEWLAEYVRALPAPRPVGVEAAIRRALMAYRHPWLYFFLTFPTRGAGRIRRELQFAWSALTRSLPW